MQNDKKRVLLAQKEEILENIKYYEKSIEDFRTINKSKIYYDEGDSSDSEDDFPTSIDTGPSVPQLKIQQAMLQTCLQATQELTSVQVLQSEVNVMVEDPNLEGEPPVKEPGLWREVTAECRIDLVPFSITFYAHQVSRKFGPTSYRGLKLLAVKTAHEAELSKSMLTRVIHPADAVEVLRSYASAYRSRRNSLARLAAKYGDDLFMEPMAEGGYLLKCGNLLEIAWRLENVTSAVAPFHHRMNFELEYMDQSYLKIIKAAHKQLSDPSIQTDERTLLLSKIISTCLEAQGPTQELSESMESDPESAKKLEKRRTTLDHDDEREIDAPMAKKKRDEQIMAPPKSLPKKAKPKGKENLDDNRRSVKRPNSEEVDSSIKKAKIDENLQNATKQGDSSNKNVIKHVDSEKNKVKNAKTASSQKKIVRESGVEKEKVVDQVKNTEMAKKYESGKETNNQNMCESKNRQDEDNSNTVQQKPKNVTKKSEPNEPKKLVNATTKDKNATSKNDQKSTENVTNKTENVAKQVKLKGGSDTQKESKKDKIDQVKNANNIESNTAKVNKNNGIKKSAKTAKNTPESVAENFEKDKNTVKNIDNDNDVAQSTKIAKKASSAGNKNIATKTVNTVKNSAKQNDKEIQTKKGPNVKTNKQTNATDEVTNKNIAKKVTSSKNNELNIAKAPKTTEVQLSNAQKPVANVKIVKNDGSTKNGEKTTTNETKNGDKNNQNNKKNENKPKSSINPKNNDSDKLKASKKSNQKQVITSSSKGDTVEKVAKVNNVATVKTKEHIADRTKDIASAQNDKKVDIRNSNMKKVDSKNSDMKKVDSKNSHIKKVEPKNIAKNQSKLVIQNLSHKNPSAQNKLPKKSISGNTERNFKGGNTGKENGSAQKISKIPQKKLSPISESALKKNPLRISPRKIPSTFKSSSDSNIKQKVLQKPITNIPRLMKKPVPKPK